MKERIKETVKRYQKDRDFKNDVSFLISTLTSLFFALFNLGMGILYQSVWNYSICIYYVLLFAVRILLSVSRKKDMDEKRVRTVFLISHIFLLLMAVALSGPILLMIDGERDFKYGMIPAITIAAYTTYRLVFGIIRYKASKKNDSLLEKSLWTVNLQDCLVSVLALQNSLIIATGKAMAEMKNLTIYTSTGIWILILIITIASFLQLRKKKKD